MKTVCIIQARMGSSRLPGKVLQDLGGKPVIQRIIDRVKKIKLVDEIVLAVPDEEASEPLVDLAFHYGKQWGDEIECVKGSEADVLSRFRAVADAVHANYYMRITGDCPFIDPDVCNQVLSMALAKRADYCSNVSEERTFPRGLDCEVFTATALRVASDIATAAYDREHVTPWIIRHAAVKHSIFSPEDLSGHTLTLDTPSDLLYLRELLAATRSEEPTTAELIAAIRENPRIVQSLAYNNVVGIHAA